jgi:hypothetical protein
MEEWSGHLVPDHDGQSTWSSHSAPVFGWNCSGGGGGRGGGSGAGGGSNCWERLGYALTQTKRLYKLLLKQTDGVRTVRGRLYYGVQRAQE